MAPPKSVFTTEEIQERPNTAVHPLPVGTKISYADYSPRVNATIVANDPTDPAFIAACQAWEQHHGDCPPELFDYCIVVDGYNPDQIEGDGAWMPVQLDGVRLERLSLDEHRQGML